MKISLFFPVVGVASALMLTSFAFSALAGSGDQNVTSPQATRSKPISSSQLVLKPVKTDWSAPGLSLKRAETSPGVWYYELHSSRSGQTIAFLATVKHQAKLLWTSGTNSGEVSTKNLEGAPKHGVKPLATCSQGCNVSISTGPDDTAIVTITADNGTVLSIYSIELLSGEITIIYTAAQ